MTEVALVTGACSGIGLALARGLRARGLDLVLVSHRPGPLAEVAAELGARAIPMDLARPQAAGELMAALEAAAVTVDVLVLNAGIFFFGEVADADPALAERLLQLHVVTPSLLCTGLCKGMRARRRGRVLVVSSISAWRDLPGIAYYGSSKRYLRSFATCLRSELAPYGVTVTCLAPGATMTGLYDPNVVPVDLATRLGVMASAESVAEAGLEGLYRGDAEVVPGAVNQAVAALWARTPQSVIDWIRRRAPWLPVKDA